jgi:hypothetical protein
MSTQNFAFHTRCMISDNKIVCFCTRELEIDIWAKIHLE